VSRNEHQCAGGEAIINVGLMAGRRVLSVSDVRSFAWLEVGKRTNAYRSPILSGGRAPTPGMIASGRGFGNKYKVNSK
jgi:hypothetical protein